MEPEMSAVIKRYNDIMYNICREHLTIGTNLSEGTKDWNLRDMVSEMQYTLDVYNDQNSIYWEDAHSDEQPSDKEWYWDWISKKRRMERFINRYKEEALKMECTEGHCSEYD